jgi:hypothetical protein
MESLCFRPELQLCLAILLKSGIICANQGRKRRFQISQMGEGEPCLLDYTGSALHVFTGSNTGSQAGPVFMCADDRARSTARMKFKEKI